MCFKVCRVNIESIDIQFRAQWELRLFNNVSIFCNHDGGSKSFRMIPASMIKTILFRLL